MWLFAASLPVAFSVALYIVRQIEFNISAIMELLLWLTRSDRFFLYAPAPRIS
ncbi:MAG: hypothetical protein F6J93_28765 [Oscillatoria sp. SIO1A7]|nr:hypothetical protein [Oscillatoria sp. SIO1A7]